jgi:hypothetical protein
VLRRLADSGVEFDRIAIAHQLDPRGPVATLLPLLREGPISCSDQVARAVVGPLPPHPGVTRALAMLDRMVGHGLQATRSIGRAGREALRDPIVFGVNGFDTAPQEGESALWYPLAAWWW